MELTPEQIKEIKTQLKEQINSTFPEDKKQEAISKIESMDNPQLIEFLKQNNMIKDPSNPETQTQSDGQCIFCSIIFGDIPSTKIAENENAIAILEINPISKGHAIILPKKHSNTADEKAQKFADEIGKLIAKKLKPKNILIQSKELMGHAAIDLLPIYENENLQSPRKKANPEELRKLQEELQEPENPEEEKTNQEKPQEKINEENTWLPKRIP